MIARRNLLGMAGTLLLIASGCTVQPLLSQNSVSGTANIGVAIDSVDTRVAQQVRNRLIFLLNGGPSEPAVPEYTATLSVKTQRRGLLNVQSDTNDSDTRAVSVVLIGSLVLNSNDPDMPDIKFDGRALASYDQSTQLFANSRAVIDAENRAAAELAEQLRNQVLAYL